VASIVGALSFFRISLLENAQLGVNVRERFGRPHKAARFVIE
jgi:hypothetical protein